MGLSVHGSDRQWVDVDLFAEMAGTFPYYIVSPPYTRLSAGIRVLQTLCAALNRLGQRAYMLVHPALRLDSAVSPHLAIPRLTAEQIESDFRHGLTPIVIYPEVVGGNIFGAPVAYEYLLNFRGVLSNQAQASSMVAIAYSEAIKRATPEAAQTLFIPTSDPRFFFPLRDGAPRHGIYYYAAKYQLLHGRLPSPPEPGAIEILRDGPDAPDRNALRAIYRTARRLYVYENSAIINEAAMCGCPVVCVPSAFFTANITRHELSERGIAWGTDPQRVSQAERTVDEFYATYLAAYGLARSQLDAFIAASQQRARDTAYTVAMQVPALRVRRAWNAPADFAARIQYRLAAWAGRRG